MVVWYKRRLAPKPEAYQELEDWRLQGIVTTGTVELGHVDPDGELHPCRGGSDGH